MSIQVNDFRWEPGKNDAEYIKLLESSRDEWQKIAQKAIAKLKAQETIEARLHLCESCKKQYPDCEATKDGIVFGNGIGNDNIIGCTAYDNRWMSQNEPRVMTWQDVIGAAIECKPIYIEVKDSDIKEPGDDRWAMVTQHRDSFTNGMIRAMSSYVTSEILFKEFYGKTWRCWNTKPSKEDMEAEPWDD